MVDGLAFALEELPLAVFTAVAPAGALCMITLMTLALSHRFTLDAAVKVSRLTWIPLSITTAGLVASASHLGTPANALYVVSGLGRSPLSNEVASAVVFLIICGINWLLSFVRTERLLPKRILAACIIVSGLVFLAFLALAYNVDTIVSWATLYTPLTLVLGGAAGSCLLTSIVVMLACEPEDARKPQRRLTVAYAAFFAAHVVAFVCQWADLLGCAGPYGSAAQFAWPFPFLIGMHAVLGTTALLATQYALRHTDDVPLGKRVVLYSLALALFLLGVVLVRFGFYMSHMTIGLGA